MITKSKIFSSKLLVIIMELILIRIPYFDTQRIVHKTYMYASVLCVVFLFLLTIVNGYITKQFIWICAFFGMMFLSTFRESGLLYEYMRDNFSSLGACLLFYLWLNNNPKVLFKAVSVLQVFVYINLLTIIMFPHGLYSTPNYDANWFLGYKNIQIRTILPIVGISIISSYYKYNRCNFNVILLILCSLLTFILNGSSTSIVGFAIFLLLFIIYKNRKLPKIFSLKNGIIVTILFFVLIVILKAQYLFDFFIEDILHKNLTFTGRTIIWERVLRLISQKLMLGYGYLTSDHYVHLLKSPFFTHPHNYILYVMMNGGLVLTAILLIGYGFANKTLKATRDSIYSKTILFVLFSFLIMGLTEAITGTILLYPVLIMAMEADKILKGESKKIQIKRRMKIK
ncbi:MAG: O-antigen ligase family protein [Ruminococcus sp.]|nr:O-antigen ligase family protein [Ruminococcus sp.]